MKPSRFEYERPADLAGAIALNRREDLAVKILAGGQSLVPMLNFRLAQPDMLVDITRIPELKRVDVSDDAITVGACVTHADFEDGRVPDVTGGALPDVARGIAYRAVRTRGTIGGSLAHADPSADWSSSLAAIGAEVILRGPAGERRVAIEHFITGVFEVSLQPGEIVEAVRIPRLSRNARFGYYKICRKPGNSHRPSARFCTTRTAPFFAPSLARRRRDRSSSPMRHCCSMATPARQVQAPSIQAPPHAY